MMPGFKVALAVSGVYVLVLSFVFPGAFAPYWPVHSDAYIFIPSAKQWLAQYIGHSIPRPIGFAVEQVLNTWGLRPGLFLNALVALAGIGLTVEFARRWFDLPQLHPISLLVYLTVLVASPGFYVAHIYDQLATLEYFFAILGLGLWVNRPAGSVSSARVWAVTCLNLASAFCKEAYVLSFITLWGCIWLRERRETPAVTAPWIAAVAGPIGAFAYLRTSQSVFTSGQQTYEVVLRPQSLLETLGAYLMPNLVWPVFLLLVGALVLAWQKKNLGRALILSGAGILALIPYASLPRHFSSFYSWTAMPLLMTPVLLIGSSANARFVPTARQSAPWLKWASILAAVGLAGLSPIAWQRYYAPQQWTLNRQQEQRQLLTNLEASNQMLPPHSRVLISGMTSVFHPFQWPAFAATLLPNADRIDFVSYHPGELKLNRGENSRTQGTKVRFISAGEVTRELLASTDRIILFSETGRIVESFASPFAVPLATTSVRSFGGEPLDYVRYPKLWEKRTALEAGKSQPYDLLALGATRYDSAYDIIAEAVLQVAAGAIPENPYPYFYLGTLNERRGALPQAHRWFGLAVDAAARGGTANPAFTDGVERTR